LTDLEERRKTGNLIETYKIITGKEDQRTYSGLLQMITAYEDTNSGFTNNSPK